MPSPRASASRSDISIRFVVSRGLPRQAERINAPYGADRDARCLVDRVCLGDCRGGGGKLSAEHQDRRARAEGEREFAERSRLASDLDAGVRERARVFVVPGLESEDAALPKPAQSFLGRGLPAREPLHRLPAARDSRVVVLGDIRPIRDVAPLMNNSQPFQILKMDRRRGNIVVSRRTVLEETRAEQRQELVQNLEEGQVIDGVVKNITDYGAFVDLGGIDGLLHVTDIAWRRVNHPTEVLTIGQTVKVKIIKINHETHRISLGMKQLLDDPWQGIEAKYPLNARFTGRVTNITDYGAFVELEPGIEGLIHVSEMSWTKKNMHPGKIVSTSQEVEVQVLEVDLVKRRISLGLKQTMRNPWEVFVEKFPVGSTVEGEVKNKTEFGLFLGLEGDVDGMVHLSDLDWKLPGEQVIDNFKKGDMVKAVVLDVDVEKERISLGVKQLEGDPFAEPGDVKKGAVVTCEVLDVKESGIDVKIVGTDFNTFIKRSELARERADQRAERFAVGEKVDARVIQFDKKARKVQVSIKALEVAEEKEAIAQYGSSDLGATLGDILGTALKQRNEK